MLSETKTQVQELINKVQVIDFVLQSLNLNHADYKEKIERQYKQASNHKLKLTSEILRLSNAEELPSISVPQDANLEVNKLTVA